MEEEEDFESAMMSRGLAYNKPAERRGTFVKSQTEKKQNQPGAMYKSFSQQL